MFQVFNMKEAIMNNNSALQQLAAFAICFVAGASTTLVLTIYARVARPSNTNGAAG